MAEAAYTWEFFAGDGAPLQLVLKAAGVPINLTGWTAQLDVRSGPDKNSMLAFTLSTANAKIVLGGALGTVVCTPLSADTVSLAGDYSYDLKLVDSAGAPQRYLRGFVRVDVPVTP